MRFTLLAALVLAAPAAALPVFVPRLDAEGFPLPREAVRRLGSARFLCGYANHLAWSADGKTVFVGGFETGISSWEVATGRCRWRSGGPATIHSLAPSTDGKGVWATASRRIGEGHSGLLLKIDGATGAALLERKLADNFIHESRVSATGRALVFNHSLIQVFDAVKDKAVYSRTRPDGLAAMWARDLSADGERLLIGESDSEGNSLRILSVSVTTGKTVHELKPTTNGGFLYGPDATTVTSTLGGGHSTPDPTGSNRPLMLTHYDLKTGKELRAMPVAPSGMRTSERYVYSPDGTRAVLVVNGVPVLFDTATWKRVREFDALRSIVCVGFSPDGKALAVGGRGLAFVDVATGKRLHGSTPFADWADDFHFAAGGRTVVCGYGMFGQLRYDVDTGKGTVKPDDAPIDLTDYQHVARDREGLRQARNVIDMTADVRQGSIELHGVGQPNVVRELPPSGDRYFERLDFTPGGRYLLGTQREAITVWDTTTDDKPRRIEWQPSPGGSSASGGRKAIACPRDCLLAIHETNSTEDEAGAWVVGIYDLASGKPVQRLSGTGLVYSTLAWSADGTQLTFGGSLSRGWDGGGFLSVYDVAAKRYVLERAKIEHMLTAIGLAPDGRAVAVHSGKGVELIEVATGGVRRTFAANGVTALAAHPDGRRFATESPTDGVLLWDSLASPAPWPTDADTLWSALAKDSATAHAAIRTLVANPAKALPLLKAKMAEVKPLPAERVVELVRQLGDRDFATRDAASKELLTHLDDARPVLKAAVADAGTNAEGKTRAAKLLAQVPPNTPDRLRVLRAVEAVELTATADAILLLRAWSVGTGFRATEATTALARRKK